MKTKIYLDQKFSNLPYKPNTWNNRRKNFFTLACALKEIGLSKDDFRFLFYYLKNSGRLPINLEWKLKYEIDFTFNDFDWIFENPIDLFIKAKYFTKTAYKKALKLAKEIKQVIDFYKN